MHIAFLTSEYPHPKITHSAGIGSSIKNLATELVKKQHRVTVFVYGADSNEVFEDNGITIHKIAYKKYAVLSWFLYRKYLQKYINKVIVNNQIEIIEAPDWTGITAFMQFKCPLLLRLHGTDAYFCELEGRKQKWKNFWFEKTALKSVNFITSVSEFTAKKTTEIFKLSKKIKVIYNGIDIEKFTISDSKLIVPNTILYFGTIIRKKGVLELATIFNEVIKKNPKANLTLLGKDVVDIFESKSTLALFKNKLTSNAKKNVVYISHVPYNQVKEYISEASVVVLPSFAEAFPMTWLEAMAMEKALVTSNIGWATELMVDGETGFIENPKNHTLYASKIVQLLEDKELNNNFGKNAKQRIKTNFSQEIIGNQNIEYFKKIIDDSV
ncbi:glycosyltransferase family 4 protein [Lutibacter sp.]